MKSKVYVRARKWLNSEDSYNSGAIQYSVVADPPWDENILDISSSLSIWDCSRKITLDFNISGYEDATRVAKKIDILQAALSDIKASLGKAYQDSTSTEPTTLEDVL